MPARKIAGYGWQRDQPDHRDFSYIPAGITLPGSVDLEPRMPAVYDQAQLGSCVAHGTAALFEYDAMRQGEGAFMPSRLDIYAKGRDLEGTPLSQDSGMEVRDGIKAVVSYGVAPESLWPYSDANPGPFQQEPPANVQAAATAHKGVQYRRVIVGTPGAPMRSAIASGLPIVFGFSVPASFEDGSWDPSAAPLPLPGAAEGFVGGHCVVAVGYDFTCSKFPVPVFKVRNSWGAGWGINGHFWMPHKWFDPAPGLATDLWVLQRVS